jgi:hypothetical protein
MAASQKPKPKAQQPVIEIVKHVPLPRAENLMQISLNRTTTAAKDVMVGRIKALGVYGPPGVGKTHSVAKAARDVGHAIKVERPDSHLALIQTLYRYRNKPFLVLDEMDHLLKYRDVLNALKVAFNIGRRRILAHDVNGPTNIKPFELHCSLIFITNMDLDTDPIGRDLAAVLDRFVLMKVPYNPVVAYEYLGYLCVEDDLLGKHHVRLAEGFEMPHKGERIKITDKNRLWRLTLDQRNYLLRYVAEHAPRMRGIGPRQILEMADQFVGRDPMWWESQIEGQLLPEPKWKFQHQISDKPIHEYEKLHVFQIKP